MRNRSFAAPLVFPGAVERRPSRLGSGIHSYARLRATLEILGAYTLLELALWSRLPAQSQYGAGMLALIVVLSIFGGRSLRCMGLSLQGIRCAWFVIPMAAAAAFVLLASAWGFGWAHPLMLSSRMHGAGYILWAFIQQFMAQSFFFVRFEEWLGGKRAVWVNAALFSAAHIPNPVLLPATFLGGLGFSEAFRRWRNVYPIWIAHAMLGMCIAAAFPTAWTHSMRVGISYLLWKR